MNIPGAPGSDKKHIMSGIIRWAVVLALLIIVYFWKKEMILEALREMKRLPVYDCLICLGLGIFYFVFEGMLISGISEENGRKLSVGRGISCSFYHAFYKFTTMGVVSGVAEIYYLHSSGVTYSKACGMSIIRYTFQRIAAALLGIYGICIIAAVGLTVAIKPVYIILGACVSLANAFVLFALSYSAHFSEFLIKITNVIFRKKPAVSERIRSQIEHFNSSGKEVWKDRRVLLKGLILGILSLLMWMMIPAVIFSSSYDVNVPVCTGLMSVVNMLAGVMISPSGVGTLEYLFTVFFRTDYGILSTTAVILYRLYTLILPAIPGLIAVIKSHCVTSDDRI